VFSAIFPYARQLGVLPGTSWPPLDDIPAWASRFLQIERKNTMSIAAERKQNYEGIRHRQGRHRFARSPVAILSERIKNLTEHFKGP
jgi:hypothetical protein